MQFPYQQAENCCLVPGLFNSVGLWWHLPLSGCSRGRRLAATIASLLLKLCLKALSKILDQYPLTEMPERS
jgi:hypothetical protein